MPADRAAVLAAIRAEWGSEELFDRFVQMELVDIFRNSKRLYQSSLKRTAYKCFELSFGG